MGVRESIIEVDNKQTNTAKNPCSPLPAGCQCYEACNGGLCDNNSQCGNNNVSGDNQPSDDNDNDSQCINNPSLCLCPEACVNNHCDNTLCDTANNPCIPLPPDCLCAQACQANGNCKNKKCTDGSSSDGSDSNSSSSGSSGGSSCESFGGTGETYSNAVLLGPYFDAANEANINIKLRGWQHFEGVLDLIDVGGDTDSKCPKFRTIFEPERLPTFTELFQVGLFQGIDHGVEPSEYAQLARWEVTPGEILKAPDHQYDLGQDIAWMVIFVDDTLLTLKGTREDGIVIGYGFHFVDICVDPQIRQLYDQGNAAGRGELPGILHGQAIGRAKTNSMIIGIRDSGAFMDPRVRKDWW